MKNMKTNLVSVLCFCVSIGLSFCQDASLCKICNCEETVITCQRQGLTSYPSTIGVSPSVKTLDLSQNKIDKLDMLDQLDSLKNLLLHHNEITMLEPNTFEHFNFLDNLDLSNNDIMKLETLMLKGLENLKCLNLSQNDLRSLPEDIFYGMPKLTELRLSGNPLHFVRYEVLAKSTLLVRLDLSEIATDFLSNDLFHQLDNLEDLDLSGNHFDVVPTQAIRSARNLKALKLNGNHIHKIDENSFTRITSLEVIELEDMPNLESVQRGAFSSLKKLKVLRIKNNRQLKTFNVGAIGSLYDVGTGVWTLEELDLEGNALETMEFPSEILCQIEVLNLQGNKWNCDCHLHWLSECEIRPELIHDLTCQSPEAHKGKAIRHLNTEEMICINRTAAEHQQRVLRTVVITCALLGIFLCGLIIIAIIKKRRIKEWCYYQKRGPGAVYYVRAQDNAKESADA